MKSRQVPAVNIEVMRDGAQSHTGSTRSLNHQIATAPGVLHAKFGEVDVGQAFAFWGPWAIPEVSHHSLRNSDRLAAARSVIFSTDYLG